ncbi:MAG: KipI antagonist [Deltaproteobacteria bacterium]|nr:MAG: KipI antagonist [Deltaproteobacteria bacterium]
MNGNGFVVLTPGALTTVQDRGRLGYQALGIPESGALDRYACQVANLLVDNPPGNAVLEMTVVGPTLAVLKQMNLAFAGADMKITLNHAPVDPWRAFCVNPGDLLAFSMTGRGCRGYLAAGGGFDLPEVMGSRATYLGGTLGGLNGRPLQKGDFLPVGPARRAKRFYRLPDEFRPVYTSPIVLRAVPGPQADYFTRTIDRFFNTDFTLGTRSDRMGCRLDGPVVPLDPGRQESIISEPIVPGSVQIPADGQPIILLGEQTTGGYAKIATVITPDLSRLAQAVPGDTIQFEPVDLKSAFRIYRKETTRMDAIYRALTGSST